MEGPSYSYLHEATLQQRPSQHLLYLHLSLCKLKDLLRLRSRASTIQFCNLIHTLVLWDIQVILFGYGRR